MNDDLLITDCLLLPEPGRLPVCGPGFIAVRDGLIRDLGPMEHCPPRGTGTVVDGQGQLAMPGLVNGHCHAAMTLFRGLADDLSLAAWLHDHIFPAEARLVDARMVEICSRLAAAEMLLAGITAVADGYFHPQAVARACADAGLRCVAAQGIVDFPAPGVEDPSRNIEAARAFLCDWQGREPLVTPALFAHSPYTCSNATLRRAKELSREFACPLFIHLAETREEQVQIAEPQAPTPVRHLDALGLLDADTVCVHVVWAEPEDLDLLAARGCRVVVCPQSNCKLASGRAPLAAMLARGIPVGLGTDGAASNNGLDLFREMDLAAKIQKIKPLDPVAVPADTILDMATRQGAAAIGLAGGCGTLAAGAPADLILIDLARPHLQPFHNPSLLVYGAGPADVTTVLVNGRLVVKGGRLLTLDVEALMGQVRELARRTAG